MLARLLKLDMLRKPTARGAMLVLVSETLLSVAEKRRRGGRRLGESGDEGYMRCAKVSRVNAAPRWTIAWAMLVRVHTHRSCEALLLSGTLVGKPQRVLQSSLMGVVVGGGEPRGSSETGAIAAEQR